MRFFVVPAIIFLIANVVIDFCLYKKLKRAGYKKFAIAYGILGIFLQILMITSVVLPLNDNGGNTTFLNLMWIMFIYLSCYIPKYVFCALNSVHSLITRILKAKKSLIATRIFIAIGVFIFALMWYGSLITRNQVDIKEVSLEYADLPAEFDGYRIAQFSDIHLGSYGTDTTYVSHLIDEINSQKVNLICFTGDIVNRLSAEAVPFQKPLSRLSAPDGVMSILGNHDYGDYYHWNDSLEKVANMQALLDFEAQIGWKLLNNSETFIHRGNDSIAIIGVENWGETPFPQYGKLHVAHNDLTDSTFKILLSHNPRHWSGEVLSKSNIKLMLSGHTHAMQMQFFGKSPASLKYPEWAGLYDHNGMKLYVNVGIGEVGIPMRIGAKPEVTIFTLKRKE